MADLLQSGLNWLGDQLEAHASQEVTYQRGASSVVLNATIGRTLLKLDDGYGRVRMVWTDRDYLVRASDLVLSGSVVTPQRGDRIVEVVGGTTFTHEVVPYSDSEPEWRWSDPHRTILRIHTKLIAQA